MIEKILSIKNVGRFVDFQLKGSSEWNGSFSKVNIIYAPNGSGKTTLTNIFQSVSNKTSTLITGRRSDSLTKKQEVKLKQFESSKIVEYSEKSWSAKIDNIVIFDIHFIEDYLFSGSTIRKNHKTNLFNFLIAHGADGQKGKVNKLFKQLSVVAKYKKAPSKKSSKEEIERHERYLSLSKAYKEAIQEYYDITKVIFDDYILHTNKYLQRFNPYVKLKSIDFSGNSSQELFRLLLTFDVHGRTVSFKAGDNTQNEKPVKFSMSEGDKNAVALAFFLAHLDRLNLEFKTIIFDDPLSSFDSARKNHTLSLLASICESSAQFFLLTHDLYFAKDFTDRVSHLSPTNIKIYNDGATSKLVHHEIYKEVTSNLQRDLMVVKEYVKNPNDNEAQKREVIRCIRPILENIFRIKYFDIILPNQWLGDVIVSIRNASGNHPFAKFKPLINDITSLNDYSKSYHHTGNSNPTETINPYELKGHCDLLLSVFYQI